MTIGVEHLSVEENPEFPGGPAKLLEYVQKNLKYPMMARESDIQGKVFVGFVVEKDGSISNVKVLRGIGGGCDEEAVRVVQSLPKFKPGKQRGNLLGFSNSSRKSFSPLKQKKVRHTVFRYDRPFVLCGPGGIRTHDLCVANAALSQLSYTPGRRLL